MIRFQNTRATIEDLNTGDVLYGWVRAIGSATLEFELPTKPDRLPGPICNVVLASYAGQAQIRTEVISLRGTRLKVHLPERVRIDPTDGKPRYQVDGVTVKLTETLDDMEVIGKVVDVSASGFAATIAASFDAGEETRVRLSTPVGDVDFVTTIIYSRMDGPEASEIRVGFQIMEFSRISRAVWARLLNHCMSRAS